MAVSNALQYPYSTIWINGQRVCLKDIIESRAIPHSDFENSTFSFIQRWFSNEIYFSTNTSGSTGAPKEITFHRSQMIESARLSEKALGLKAGYSALISLDTKYIAGKMMLVRSFITGMQIIALDPTANPLVKIPIDIHIDFAALVPYQVMTVLESKHPHLLNNLLTVIIGGAPLPENVRARLNAFSCSCFLTYGMTETLTHVALQPINEHTNDSCFQMLPHVSIETDSRGCAVISAPHLSGKIITNDMIEIVGEKKFVWLGRWDNVINTGGVKVFPEKIETVVTKLLEDLSLNAPFFIHGTPDEKWGQKIVLIIAAPELSQDQLQCLIQSINRSIPAMERPKEIWISPSFNYTETGKINRLQSLQNVSLNITITK